MNDLTHQLEMLERQLNKENSNSVLQNNDNRTYENIAVSDLIDNVENSIKSLIINSEVQMMMLVKQIHNSVQQKLLICLAKLQQESSINLNEQIQEIYREFNIKIQFVSDKLYQILEYCEQSYDKNDQGNYQNEQQNQQQLSQYQSQKLNQVELQNSNMFYPKRMMSSSQRFFASSNMNCLVSKIHLTSMPTKYEKLSSIVCFKDDIIVGTSNGTLSIYKKNESLNYIEYQVHSKSIGVLIVAHLDEQKLLISGSQDHTIQVFKIIEKQNLELEQRCSLISHHAAILDLMIINNMSLGNKSINALLSGSQDNTLTIWDLNQAELLYVYSGHKSDINSIAYSNKLNLICSGSKDSTIRIWNVNSLKITPCRACKVVFIFTGHKDSVTGVHVSKEDENMLISCSLDGTIRVWDIELGIQLRMINATIEISAMRWIQPGNICVVSNKQMCINIYDYVLSVQINSNRTTMEVENICIDNMNIYTVQGQYINLYR